MIAACHMGAQVAAGFQVVPGYLSVSLLVANVLNLRAVMAWAQRLQVLALTASWPAGTHDLRSHDTALHHRPSLGGGVGRDSALHLPTTPRPPPLLAGEQGRGSFIQALLPSQLPHDTPNIAAHRPTLTTSSPAC